MELAGSTDLNDDSVSNNDYEYDIQEENGR